MKRSYNQNCALSHALDLVGERWTLLIFRELLIGECRFGELLSNLDGMGSNLLAARLRELVAHKLIEKTPQGYALTSQGLLLEPVLHGLVRFGLTLGVEYDASNLTRPAWDVVALRALYQPELDTLTSGRYLLELDQQPFCIEKINSELRVQHAVCDNPGVVVSMGKSTARQLASGLLALDEAMRLERVSITGNKRTARKLLRAFGLQV